MVFLCFEPESSGGSAATADRGRSATRGTVGNLSVLLEDRLGFINKRKLINITYRLLICLSRYLSVFFLTQARACTSRVSGR